MSPAVHLLAATLAVKALRKRAEQDDVTRQIFSAITLNVVLRGQKEPDKVAHFSKRIAFMVQLLLTPSV